MKRRLTVLLLENGAGKAKWWGRDAGDYSTRFPRQ